MKTILSFVFATILLTGSFGQAHEIDLTDPELLLIQQQVLLPFFEALKTGNVSEIKKHMSESLYEKNRVLLEDNADYPDFLRSYYRDVHFRVVKAETGIADDDIFVHVAFKFSDGSNSVNELKISKRKQDGQQSDTWVIDKF